MPGILRKVAVFILIIFLAQLWVKPTRGVVSSCAASVDTSTVNINTTVNITFTVNNNDSVPFVWVRVTRPSTNFTINSGSSNGWSPSATSSTITFTESNISAGGSGTFQTSVSIGSTTAASANWTVQVSDSSDGSNPYSCQGGLGTAIVDQDTSSPIIFGLSVSEVTDTSAKISWTTDENTTGTVNHGTTISYGSTTTTSLGTSHSITLTGLSGNTTYHYVVIATDSSSNSDETDDSTFVTSKQQTTVTTTVTTTQTVTKTVADTTVPDIAITSDLSGIFTKAPTIKGKASDDIGVTSVDYSLDDGRNWLSVDELSEIGAKTVTFDFTPLGLTDGNYKIRARVTDPSGNETLSKSSTLVIDRLPPMVGPTFISVGPQSLKPTLQGLMVTLPNLDQKIVLSSVGGATEINLTIGTDKDSKENKLFSLVKNPDNGLWWGTLSFEKPGLYRLFANSLDGAGNTTESQLNSFYVLPSGKVTDANIPIRAAEVTLYFREPTTNRFVIWDAQPYVQTNPQRTGVEGEYVFFPPAGTYYLEVRAQGYKTLKSEIFELNESMPLASGLILSPKTKFSLGPIFFSLPSFIEELFAKAYEIEISKPSNLDLNVGEDVLNKEFPLSEVYGLEGKLSTLSFRGKPTVLSLLTSWGPTTSEQLMILENFSRKNQLIRTSAVLVHDQQSVARIFQKIGDYDIEILADPDGNLIQVLNLNLLPTHVFLDRKGVVKNIKVGVISEDELLEGIRQ